MPPQISEIFTSPPSSADHLRYYSAFHYDYEFDDFDHVEDCDDLKQGGGEERQISSDLGCSSAISLFTPRFFLYYHNRVLSSTPSSSSLSLSSSCVHKSSPALLLQRLELVRLPAVCLQVLLTIVHYQNHFAQESRKSQKGKRSEVKAKLKEKLRLHAKATLEVKKGKKVLSRVASKEVEVGTSNLSAFLTYKSSLRSKFFLDFNLKQKHHVVGINGSLLYTLRTCKCGNQFCERTSNENLANRCQQP